jgi:hypothetical protein
VKATLLIILTTATGAVVCSGQAPHIAEAPRSIQELAAGIQAKSPTAVRDTIVERYGRPKRDIGSGIHIEQWDTSGGVLTLNQNTGPTFFDVTTQRCYHLLSTTNSVDLNLLQSYEMSTLPDPANHGTMFWLGNLEFDSGTTYRFKESGQVQNPRALQIENFFIRCPVGKVAVRYGDNVSPGTLLETLPEGATIAHLIFTSPDGKDQATFSIISSERSRRLQFGGDKPLTFAMDTVWKRFW